MPSLCLVGSGPAAFYTAMRAIQRVPTLEVAMFEKLAVPFGLTRFGVAPDHPEVKNCQERFAEVAASPNFKFFGNCTVGKDVGLKDLAANFDAVLLSYGAQSERRLGIPGEQLPGVLSARQFVGWYNGEPQFQHLDMAHELRQAESATIIGNGNVALDVARMLLRDPRDLAPTDITENAVRQLESNRVKHVQIAGRRGVLQSAFTNKELRELQQEPGTHMRPVLPPSELAQAASKPLQRVDKRKVALLEKTSATPPNGTNKTWQLAFLRSPLRFVGEDRVQGIEWMLNKVDEAGKIHPTGHTEFQATDLVFTSIGYKSLPLPGMSEIGIDFDGRRGTVPRSRGQVVGPSNIFASGWVGTGPVGVIAATMMDSFAVGEEIVNFVATHTGKPGLAGLNLRGNFVSWEDWLKVDAEEIRRGRQHGKPREKFTSDEAVLDFVHK